MPELPLRTERLVFHSDAQAVRYVPYPARDRSAVATVLQRKVLSTELRADGDLVELAVELAADGTVVGDVLLALRSHEHATLEVGYIFSPAHGGRGDATEAHLVENEWFKGELTDEVDYAVLAREWGTSAP